MNDAQRRANEEVIRKKGVLKMAEGVVDRALEDLRKANQALNDAIVDDPISWIEDEYQRYEKSKYVEL